MVHTASGVDPVFIGKPHAPMWEFIRDEHGAIPEETLMVGDR